VAVRSRYPAERHPSQAAAGTQRLVSSGLIYDELREATQPVTTRELVERIMRLKAIPAADDQRRERVQKTLLALLNREKQTIERVEIAGVVRWRLI
jgi:hypothetical protein